MRPDGERVGPGVDHGPPAGQITRPGWPAA
jgi:hypothetical protein